MNCQRKFDIGFGNLGNGITVYNRAMEIHGDYERIAHIAVDRRVTFYNKVPADVRREIEHFAATENPRISQTQSGCVFSSIAEPEEEPDDTRQHVSSLSAEDQFALECARLE